MVNKYQEALDKIRQYMSIYDQALIPMAFQDLQDLIKKDEYMRNELTMLCKKINMEKLSKKQLEREVRKLNGEAYK